MNRLPVIAVATAIAAVSLPAGASAHVTVQPAEVPAGAFKRLDVRVPNERDDASTTKVEVKFPPGFLSVSHEAVAGWDVKVKLAKLAEPVEFFGEERSERVDTVTFTARGKGVRPGQFQDFGLSVALPDKPGTSLTFKAVQTYSGGEVVRWIGAAGSDEPAPQVRLTAAPAESAAAQAPAAPAAEVEDEDDGNALSVIALIAGVLGLLAGLAGLAAARRARGTAAA